MTKIAVNRCPMCTEPIAPPRLLHGRCRRRAKKLGIFGEKPDPVTVAPATEQKTEAEQK